MTVSAPPPLPYFWHVWCWGDVAGKLEVRLLDTGFGYFGSGVWYHQKKHAMFLWQLDNAEFVSNCSVRITEHQFNMRQHKSRKSQKNC